VGKAMQAVHLRTIFFCGLCIKFSQPFLRDVIQAFLIDLQSTGKFFVSVFIKHRGLMAFPVTKSFSISPAVKPQKATVRLILQSFPQEYFYLSKTRVFLGNAQKK
jgi:hypothetical protein